MDVCAASFPLVVLNSVHSTTGARAQFTPAGVKARVKVPITATVRFCVSRRNRCVHGNMDCHKFACNPTSEDELEPDNYKVNAEFLKTKVAAKKEWRKPRHSAASDSDTDDDEAEFVKQKLRRHFDNENSCDVGLYSCRMSVFAIDDMFEHDVYDALNRGVDYRTACKLDTRQTDVFEFRENFCSLDTITEIVFKWLSVTSNDNFTILFKNSSNALWKTLANNSLITVTVNKNETPVMLTTDEFPEATLFEVLDKMRQIVLAQLYHRVDCNANEAVATFAFDLFLK